MTARKSFRKKRSGKCWGPRLGLQLLMIPEAYGGLGGGARDSCAVTREMAKICLGVTTAFFAIQLGADPLMVGGTEEQKQKWLGKIAAGEALVAYAVTEPDAGSNVAALKTKADPVNDDSGELIGFQHQRQQAVHFHRRLRGIYHGIGQNAGGTHLFRHGKGHPRLYARQG